MRRLKVLALSDLHLGEPEGLLRDRGVNIIDVVVAKVSELARGKILINKKMPLLTPRRLPLVTGAGLGWVKSPWGI